MSWLKLDDGFDTHPKVLELTEVQRWRWTRVLIHCARHRTGGHVKASVLRELGLSRTTDKLITVGLLESNGEAGYLVHDWSEYAPKDPTKAERQARWRAKQPSTPASTETPTVDAQRDASVDDQIVHSRADAPARPVPSPKEQHQPPNHVAQQPEGGRDSKNGIDPEQDLAVLIAKAAPEDIPF